PWLLSGYDPGDHVLELGAGPGATTNALAQRAARVVSLEYDHKFAANLAARNSDKKISVVQADAATLPFADESFSAATAILVLHHLRSPQLQDSAFREVFRVLRPGGVFLAGEIPNSWIHRVAHIKSTFVPVSPESATARLKAAGFTKVAID